MADTCAAIRRRASAEVRGTRGRRYPRHARGGGGPRYGATKEDLPRHVPSATALGPVASAREVELEVRQVVSRSAADSHQWIAGGPSIFRRCRLCLRGWFRTAAVPRCDGVSVRLRALLDGAMRRVHRLSLCANPRDAKLVACLRCGAWAEAGMGRGLRATCHDPTLTGRRSLKRLRRGLHPTGRSSAPSYGTRVDQLLPLGA